MDDQKEQRPLLPELFTVGGEDPVSGDVWDGFTVIDQARKDLADYAAKYGARDREELHLDPDEEESIDAVWTAIEIFGWDTFLKSLRKP